MSFTPYDARCNISEMIGKTFVRIEQDSEQVIFWAENKSDSFSLFHNQDCCESVYLEDVVGDLEDLENSPILVAEEVTSTKLPPLSEYAESYTWTFYKFSTIKGSVTLRWYGSSNGYYSESVDCYKWIEEEDESRAS